MAKKGASPQAKSAQSIPFGHQSVTVLRDLVQLRTENEDEFLRLTALLGDASTISETADSFQILNQHHSKPLVIPKPPESDSSTAKRKTNAGKLKPRTTPPEDSQSTKQSAQNSKVEKVIAILGNISEAKLQAEYSDFSAVYRTLTNPSTDIGAILDVAIARTVPASTDDTRRILTDKLLQTFTSIVNTEKANQAAKTLLVIRYLEFYRTVEMIRVVYRFENSSDAVALLVRESPFASPKKIQNKFSVTHTRGKKIYSLVQEFGTGIVFAPVSWSTVYAFAEAEIQQIISKMKGEHPLAYKMLRRVSFNADCLRFTADDAPSSAFGPISSAGHGMQALASTPTGSSPPSVAAVFSSQIQSPTSNANPATHAVLPGSSFGSIGRVGQPINVPAITSAEVPSPTHSETFIRQNQSSNMSAKPATNHVGSGATAGTVTAPLNRWPLGGLQFGSSQRNWGHDNPDVRGTEQDSPRFTVTFSGTQPTSGSTETFSNGVSVDAHDGSGNSASNLTKEQIVHGIFGGVSDAKRRAAEIRNKNHGFLNGPVKAYPVQPVAQTGNSVSEITNVAAESTSSANVAAESTSSARKEDPRGSHRTSPFENSDSKKRKRAPPAAQQQMPTPANSNRKRAAPTSKSKSSSSAHEQNQASSSKKKPVEIILPAPNRHHSAAAKRQSSSRSSPNFEALGRIFVPKPSQVGSKSLFPLIPEEQIEEVCNVPAKSIQFSKRK